MRNKKEFKFYIAFYYLDKCENLQQGYCFIWSRSESDAINKAYRLADKKCYTIMSFIEIKLIDEREVK